MAVIIRPAFIALAAVFFCNFGSCFSLDTISEESDGTAFGQPIFISFPNPTISTKYAAFPVHSSDDSSSFTEGNFPYSISGFPNGRYSASGREILATNNKRAFWDRPRSTTGPGTRSGQGTQRTIRDPKRSFDI